MKFILACLVCLAVTALPSKALVFKPLDTSSGRVLLIRDCGNSRQYHPSSADGGVASQLYKIMQADDTDKPGDRCSAWEQHFSGRQTDKGRLLYAGDAVRLEQILDQEAASGRPYREVWLFSGGGNVDAAIRMARIFRARQITLRLKSGFDCVSACTIAFMGGFFRYMEDGATYQVHSASSYSGGVDDDELQGILKAPDAALSELAKEEQVSSRLMAIRIFRVFQNTLDLPLGVHLPENDDAFEEWAKSDVPDWSYLAAQSAERASDVARIKTEGKGATQDILMRLERECIQLAISDLERVEANLGARAYSALGMLRLMYMTSIMETAALNRTTMLQKGYLTQEAGLP